ncbi:DNA mismatch repair endonuclease MutL [Thalassotalea euphylliae]|uniref:DNA mismatch repair endonuclease MutL n=1 Tax=Thalassotalea euphylliae TaxID=1655234 RepID=UPI00363FFB51
MSIQILPARLANQIAAGEVVERPASVVKELVENSLDAGATKIVVEIDKGGAKRIRISDNGKGIIKDELTLALSRHATSKIKDLSDLEAISSLGFRGEALASISSVARLTLTSKPAEQETAWQAFAQGRDMDVTIQPAAHPDGTTIEVTDLFFNTPARRKFLRTEKTEFTHIDEVIRRIALACFDVSFTLIHNGKTIRQYRAARSLEHYSKRVAAVCGQKFIDSAVTVDCHHDGMHLWGWLASPEYFRVQNDLCYSYVNGRMMRDKLINHGIRQAFAELLPNDAYPAFVLYLDLDHREVDVNVHPAKHEVRFHQGRYVHDFIYSVCHKAIVSGLTPELSESHHAAEERGVEYAMSHHQPQSQSTAYSQPQSKSEVREYVTPLRQSSASGYSSGYQPPSQSNIPAASAAYSELLRTVEPAASASTATKPNDGACQQVHCLYIENGMFAATAYNDKLMLTSLNKLATTVNQKLVEQRWPEKFVSQPLLLPVLLKASKEQCRWVNANIDVLEHIGVVLQVNANHQIQVRQFPALLRAQDVNRCMEQILLLAETAHEATSVSEQLKSTLACLLTPATFDLTSAQQLFVQGQTILGEKFIAEYLLNSTAVDLTSEISQLQ